MSTLTTSSMTASSPHLDITLLGTGWGESIIIGLGNGDWAIVDCLISKKVNGPLEFLKENNVSPSRVKLIVATHWDDDHIKGISELVSVCEQADFYTTYALNDSKFQRLILNPHFCQKQTGKRKRNCIEELNSVYHHLKGRGKKPKFASENTNLYKKGNIEIVALSPNQDVVLQAIKSLIPQTEDIPFNIPNAPRSNLTSVVLWIKTSQGAFLLGADLDEKSPMGAWTTLIANDKTTNEDKARYFKVPHHGAISGHCNLVWSKLLTPNPICTVAPWRCGGNFLPKPSDIKRLKEQTNSLYIILTEKGSVSKSKNIHVKKFLDGIGAQPIKEIINGIRYQITGDEVLIKKIGNVAQHQQAQ